MNKQLLFTFFISLFLLSACGSAKKAVEQGDYDKAITDLSLDLKKNPDNEGKALLLQEAYNNATARDLERVKVLEQQASTDATKWFDIYNIYDRMLIREIQVLPLLPLYAEGRELEFNVPNVDGAAEDAQAKASRALYDRATVLYNRGDKQSAREAYQLYDQLVEFNFDYLDARDQRDFAKMRGSTNVFVNMNNQTGRSLPETFEDDLLTFREGSFTDPWILYHTKRNAGVNYEYEVDLDISELIVGRDSEQQRQFREQNRVIVGYKEGRDSEGNTVRIPQYATVYADILETLQSKPIRVAGTATYKDATGKVLATLPVEREEAWQNSFAQFRGDERALSQETIAKIQNGRQQFPTDAQLYELSGKLLNQVVVNLFETNATNLQ